MTGIELAHSVGKKSTSYVSKLENGEGGSNVKEAARLFEALVDKPELAKLYTEAFELDTAIKKYEGRPLLDPTLARSQALAIREMLKKLPNGRAVYHICLVDPPDTQEDEWSVETMLDAVPVEESHTVLAAKSVRLGPKWGEYWFPVADLKARKWNGPARMMVVDWKVAVASDGWRLCVTYDPERVDAIYAYFGGDII
jgi:hypothetical protein